MHPSRIITLAAMAVLFLGGCDWVETVDALECDLTVGPSSAPMDAVATLTATRQGTGSISSITYRVDDNAQTFSNPTLPWTRTFQIEEGASVSMDAAGSVEDGQLRIEMSLAAAASNASFSLTENDDCSQEVE